MKFLLTFVLCSLLILTSCSDDINCIEPTPVNPQDIEDVTISKDGYLTFPSAKSLEQFFEQVQNGETPTIYSQSRSGGSFESVAMLDERISKSNKSRAMDLTPITENELEDLEEMTQDEYNLMKAEDLLFDDLMTHAMDTTLRICVEGELYKITENGTFSVKLEKADKLDLAIKEFNPELKETIDAGETVQLNPDVNFTNTFKNVRVEESELLELEPADYTPLSRAAAETSQNEFHKNYNVDSYRWKNTNVIKRFLDFIRGKDVSKSKNFSKKRRVQVNIFDVNYRFYKSAGIKVKMQKRKKFCFVPYWVGIEADKLVLGFNEMEGVLTYNSPNNLSIINPSASAKWSAFKGTLNGITSNFIYGTFNNLKFIRDWTDWAFGWMPEVRIGDKNYTDKILNKIYNAPAEYVYKQSKSLINKKVYAPIEKQIKPTDPMVAYLYWGSSEFTFNKERPFITGIKEYSHKKSKSVIFDRSFGVSFIGVVPVPYTPSDFDIKSIDAFGAAYYDNKWLGVRFYGK
jgi:hypothetical protein